MGRSEDLVPLTDETSRRTDVLRTGTGLFRGRVSQASSSFLRDTPSIELIAHVPMQAAHIVA